MTSVFDSAHPPASYFDQPIQALEARIDSLKDELKAATEQLEWWRKGRARWVGDDQDAPTDEDHEWRVAQARVDPNSKITELIPSSDVPKPTLRQAILRVLLDRPNADGHEPEWQAAQLMDELERRNWMPDSADYAEGSVRRMLRTLVRQGQLVNLPGGKCALAPGVRNRGGKTLGAPAKPGVVPKLILDAVAELDRPKPTEMIAFLRSRGESPNRGSVHNALARLVAAGTLVRVGEGRYELPSRNGTEHASTNGSSGEPSPEATSLAGGYER